MKCFDINCVEMGVEAIDITTIEKSRDELFTSGKASTSVCVIKARYSGEICRH